jgi:hypothetical protein
VPYKLDDLAQATGMSISGVHTAYDDDEIVEVPSSPAPSPGNGHRQLAGPRAAATREDLEQRAEPVSAAARVGSGCGSGQRFGPSGPRANAVAYLWCCVPPQVSHRG